MEFRKMVMMALYARQQKRHRCKEQTFKKHVLDPLGWMRKLCCIVY